MFGNLENYNLNVRKTASGWLIIICLLAFLPPSLAAAANSIETLPDVILWAWQKPEDLSSIDPKVMGVAYLSCRILIAQDSVVSHWRDQTLKVPPQTSMMPVVRIDVDHRHPANLSDTQLESILNILKRAVAIAHSNRLQIDFDALQSERTFYSRLIKRISEDCPHIQLSITCLASWCLFDQWTNDLPISETVPMMFTLGAERKNILARFKHHGDFLLPGCRRALGISLEDKEVNALMIPLAQQRTIPVRIYIFTRGAWNAKKLNAVQSLLAKQ
jgi:hypothetical protein